jgi:hypothetical protein
LRELNDSHTNDLLVEFERKAATGMIDLPVSFWFAIDKGYTSLFERLVEQYPNGPNPNGCVNKGRTTLVSELLYIYKQIIYAEFYKNLKSFDMFMRHIKINSIQ